MSEHGPQILPPRIILVNGPPSSGKDTTGKILQETVASTFAPVLTEKFSKPLKIMACCVADITLAQLEEWKEDERPEFFGLTGRQFQIMISEQWFKPAFGKCVFGRMAGRRIANMVVRGQARIGEVPILHNIRPVVVITDSGFVEEAVGLIDELDELASHIMLLTLDRDGYTFDGDSRGHITKQQIYDGLREAGALSPQIFARSIAANTVFDLQAQVVMAYQEWTNA